MILAVVEKVCLGKFIFFMSLFFSTYDINELIFLFVSFMMVKDLKAVRKISEYSKFYIII